MQNAGEEGRNSTASGASSEPVLSVSADDSGITSIPLVTLTLMWNKAFELLSTSNGITPAPGDDPKARMVIYRSQVVLESLPGQIFFLPWKKDSYPGCSCFDFGHRGHCPLLSYINLCPPMIMSMCNEMP